MKPSQDMEVVRTLGDVARLDQRRVVLAGVYRAVERPVKGAMLNPRPRDHALIELADAGGVYLEPLDSPAAKRAPDEIKRFDGKRVSVSGIIHKIMPARGQGLLAPCLSEATRLVENDGTEAGT